MSREHVFAINRLLLDFGLTRKAANTHQFNIFHVFSHKNWTFPNLIALTEFSIAFMEFITVLFGNTFCYRIKQKRWQTFVFLKTHSANCNHSKRCSFFFLFIVTYLYTFNYLRLYGCVLGDLMMDSCFTFSPAAFIFVVELILLTCRIFIMEV